MREHLFDSVSAGGEKNEWPKAFLLRQGNSEDLADSRCGVSDPWELPSEGPGVGLHRELFDQVGDRIVFDKQISRSFLEESHLLISSLIFPR